jgi:hypothetical protein
MTVYEQPITTRYQAINTPLTESYAPYVPVPSYDPAEVLVRRRMLTILGLATAVIVLLATFVLPKLVTGETAGTVAPPGMRDSDNGRNGETAAMAATGSVSAVFSPEVQHWAPQIEAWAAAHELDPNLVATIMQIESCGDPEAVSSAGAQGLFQVMPFHFAAGENTLDPKTNAERGLAYFAERLRQTSGDIGKALAGYNGGHVAAAGSWETWLPETQRYYVWSTGIYQDIQAGLTASPTLQEWMEAGGASLCRQAAARLGLQ